MVEEGAILELIRPGPYYWSTPDFHDARLALERAYERPGPYTFADGVMVHVVKSARGEADTWMVAKTEGNDMKFKSKATSDEEYGLSVRLWNRLDSSCAPRLTPCLACHAPFCGVCLQGFMVNFGFDHEYATLRVRAVHVQRT